MLPGSRARDGAHDQNVFTNAIVIICICAEQFFLTEEVRQSFPYPCHLVKLALVLIFRAGRRLPGQLDLGALKLLLHPAYIALINVGRHGTRVLGERLIPLRDR
jgi:hypothetical protein